MEKNPLPLKSPLSKLSKDAFAPYKFELSTTLPSAVEDALGADEYLDWVFVDTSITDVEDPTRYVHFVVTYNTGGRDLVPHTPDQCFLGQGYQPVEMENVSIEVPALQQTIPMRVLTFVKTALQGGDRPTVTYLFHCNGQFVATRNDVRYLINTLNNRYAYFSKIELTFGALRANPHNASREDSVKAAAKFLDRVLPVLLENHFPDWEAAIQAERAAEPAAATTGRTEPAATTA